jgi:two-component system, NarL family, nitrate/nitrite response regulator NarL
MHPWMLKPDLKRPISLGNGIGSVVRNSGRALVARNGNGTGTIARSDSHVVPAPRTNGQVAGSSVARSNGQVGSAQSEGAQAQSGDAVIRRSSLPGVGDVPTRRTNGTKISIVIADDHPITLAGLDSLFSRETDFNVLARCSDPYEAIKAVTRYQPDVLVLDQEMPVMDGVAVVKQLRRAHHETRVVLLATKEDHLLAEALQLGVQGIVYKNVDPRNLTRCVREVHAGRKWADPRLTSQFSDRSNGGPVLNTLTRRQFEVARAAVSGLSNKELAQQLGVSEGTIKNHLHAIYERLNVDGRLALLLYLKEKALV